LSTIAPMAPLAKTAASGNLGRNADVAVEANQPTSLQRLLARARATWIAMDERDIGRRVPGTAAVAISGMLVQFVAALISVGNGAALWYADALSHLVISGRIVTGYNAGVQQLGTVWLPAPHLIMAPLSANLWLWQTGWAAAIVGVLAMGASVAAIYRICARLGLGRNARLLASVAFLFNPSALYLYTTAMTEPVLFAALLGSVAGLTHYATAKRPLSSGELAAYAGIPAAIAMLSRYEGWVLLAAGVLFILLVEFRKARSVASLRKIFAFVFPLIGAIVVLPLIAVGWWGMYNFVNFGNPIEFIYGEYSAFTQQEVLANQGLLTTKENMAMTLTVIGGAAWQVVTPVIIILGGIGLVWLFTTRGWDTILFAAGVLFSPFVFNIAALYLGQTTIQNDFSIPTGYFNTRYALTLLPLMAFCIGVFVEAFNGKDFVRRVGKFFPRLVSVAVFAAITLQSAYVLADPIQRSPVIEEGDYQVNGIRGPVNAVWDYLDEHYDGSSILVDEVSNQLRPQAGIPLKDFYMLASGNHFYEVLERPAATVGWLIVNTNDESHSHHQDVVWDAMAKFPENFAVFRRVAEASGIALYQAVR
jgi:hypothetical protein